MIRLNVATVQYYVALRVHIFILIVLVLLSAAEAQFVRYLAIYCRVQYGCRRLCGYLLKRVLFAALCICAAIMYTAVCRVFRVLHVRSHKFTRCTMMSTNIASSSDFGLLPCYGLQKLETEGV